MALLGHNKNIFASFFCYLSTSRLVGVTCLSLKHIKDQLVAPKAKCHPILVYVVN